MKISVICGMQLCRFVCRYHCFRGDCCLFVQGGLMI